MLSSNYFSLQTANVFLNFVKKFAVMIKYEPTAQIKIEEFKTPFAKKLLPNNRWVILSQIVPWDKFASMQKEEFFIYQS